MPDKSQYATKPTRETLPGNEKGNLCAAMWVLFFRKAGFCADPSIRVGIDAQGTKWILLLRELLLYPREQECAHPPWCLKHLCGKQQMVFRPWARQLSQRKDGTFPSWPRQGRCRVVAPPFYFKTMLYPYLLSLKGAGFSYNLYIYVIYTSVCQF